MIQILLVLVFLVPGLLQPSADPISQLDGVERIDDVIIVNDVPYGTTNDGSRHARQIMDVAMPVSREGTLPVVIVIHGGGWSRGDKADVRMFLEPLAKAGCLVISPNYRLAPKDPAPAAIHDMKYLLAWLDRHSEELTIDSSKIAMVGFSAGGHLSALVGMSADTRALDPASDDMESPSVAPCCMASIGGPMDLSRPFSPQVEPLVKGWAGAVSANGGTRSLWSPVRWVTRKDPPILLIHGEADDIVPLGNISGMKSQCERQGVVCKIHIVDGGSHIPDPDTWLVPLSEFLDDHLDTSLSIRLKP